MPEITKFGSIKTSVNCMWKNGNFWTGFDEEKRTIEKYPEYMI